MGWLNITDDLTKEGRKKIKTGQVLFFDYEGSELQLRIMRKRGGKIWAKRVYMYRPDEVEINDKKQVRLR